MKNFKIPNAFSYEFVGGLEKLNDLISKARIRIYYKGGNRNGTWITDEFAEKLNSTLPFVPIVATYNEETEDFEDHTEGPLKKAYGFVPHDGNFDWELAEDGKEYYSTDVYLWTGYWPEAAKLLGKSHSMELIKESIVGSWQVVHGDYYFVYQSGAFKGLCGLGEIVLPCFEESAFYSLDSESRSFFESANEGDGDNLKGGKEMAVNKYNKNVESEEATVTENTEVTREVEVEAVVETEETVVETEDVAEVEAETNFEAEVEAEVEAEAEVEDVVDSSATEEFAGESAEEDIEGPELISSGDSISIRESSEDFYKNEDGSVTVIRQDSEQWISIETYYELQAENTQLKEKIAQLESENSDLSVYKAKLVKQEKEAVVDQFKNRLSEEEISPFVESIDNYTTEQLRTELKLVFAEKMLNSEPEKESSPANYISVISDSKSDGIAGIIKRNTRK